MGRQETEQVTVKVLSNISGYPERGVEATVELTPQVRGLLASRDLQLVAGTKQKTRRTRRANTSQDSDDSK